MTELVTEQHVELPMAIPPELRGDFLGKLRFVSESLADYSLVPGELEVVVFRTKPGRESDAGVIAERIQIVARQMCTGHRPYVPKLLASERRVPYRLTENPRDRLMREGQLFEFGPGRFGLGPLIVRLLELFERRLLKLADDLDATRYQFPALLGADVLYQTRYIESFPHCLTLTSHLREDLDLIQDFARKVTVQDGAVSCPSASLAAPKCLLAPTVCFHYYAWLRDTALLQPQTITASGHCFRYESGNMATLERLWDFTMREIVFVGPGKYVIQQRDRCIELTQQVLEEWELGYEILTATDPFFIEGYSTQVSFQASFELKYEIRADLPYADGKSLAVGSFNFHQDFFGRSLHIQLPDATNPAMTGCVGFGMERLAWAFLSQHGTDPRHWPAAVRSQFSV